MISKPNKFITFFSYLLVFYAFSCILFFNLLSVEKLPQNKRLHDDPQFNQEIDFANSSFSKTASQEYDSKVHQQWNHSKMEKMKQKKKANNDSPENIDEENFIDLRNNMKIRSLINQEIASISKKLCTNERVWDNNGRKELTTALTELLKQKRCTRNTKGYLSDINGDNLQLPVITCNNKIFNPQNSKYNRIANLDNIQNNDNTYYQEGTRIFLAEIEIGDYTEDTIMIPYNMLHIVMNTATWNNARQQIEAIKIQKKQENAAIKDIKKEQATKNKITSFHPDYRRLTFTPEVAISEIHLVKVYLSNEWQNKFSVHVYFGEIGHHEYIDIDLSKEEGENAQKIWGQCINIYPDKFSFINPNIINNEGKHLLIEYLLSQIDGNKEANFQLRAMVKQQINNYNWLKNERGYLINRDNRVLLFPVIAKNNTYNFIFNLDNNNIQDRKIDFASLKVCSSFDWCIGFSIHNFQANILPKTHYARIDKIIGSIMRDNIPLGEITLKKIIASGTMDLSTMLLVKIGEEKEKIISINLQEEVVILQLANLVHINKSFFNDQKKGEEDKKLNDRNREKIKKKLEKLLETIKGEKLKISALMMENQAQSETMEDSNTIYQTAQAKETIPATEEEQMDLQALTLEQLTEKVQQLKQERIALEEKKEERNEEKKRIVLIAKNEKRKQKRRALVIEQRAKKTSREQNIPHETKRKKKGKEKNTRGTTKRKNTAREKCRKNKNRNSIESYPMNIQKN